ncbi:MAG TPA: PBP1A family penicillin-binding protein [Terracidiphilus sp.]|nr:PBP1A family penicillin-binding protein [Terracidiphilus sp.]
MALKTLKIRLTRPRGRHPWAMLLVKVCVLAMLVAGLSVVGLCGFYYVKYQPIVSARLEKPLFKDTAKIYAAPQEVRPGQRLSLKLVAQNLREAGYTTDGASQPSPMGTFSMDEASITVRPGSQSYHTEDPATIHIHGGAVDSITDAKGRELASYELEPLLITGLSEGAQRTKRRLVTYDELPKNMVNAVVAIEDRRFFEHGGVDFIRLGGALVNDLKPGHKWTEGGSTLTMQLARGFFLTPQRKIKRKLKEIVITFQLEHRFTKQQIFAMYANEINLGERGSFSIDGFGEAAQAYFGKDVRQLDLQECALLAGMIQSPNRLNPFRHPKRVIERRNLVLDSMVETGAITKEVAEQAKQQPLQLVKSSVDESEAPYFVDLVRDQLVQTLGDRDFNREGLRIYTSLDPDLQRLASEAVNQTIPIIDELVDKKHARDRKRGISYSYPQVALVALNPHTGQVLALVGGKNYGESQLDHAVAKRPTGSIFKPFVYATAFQTAVDGTLLPGHTKLFSPTTMLNDQQTTYDGGNGRLYTPRNYEREYYGELTARFALMRSDNNATISLASMVGFDRVAQLARDSGVLSARGTPAMAIGSYDASPLEMAGAYTVFANSGLHLQPWMLASIRTQQGDVIDDFTPASKQVLDPRTAFLTTSLMEAVLQGKGTGAVVRNMGFTAPAAGKTGTSHDAWFAGFTSNLLCVVWVGNDDYSDVKLEGAQLAAPIWANFMKNAVQLPQYSDTHDFTPPDGVDVVTLDNVTNLLADAACPDDYQAAFLAGTEPTDTCDHPGDHRNLFQKIFGLGKPSQ